MYGVMLVTLAGEAESTRVVVSGVSAIACVTPLFMRSGGLK